MSSEHGVVVGAAVGLKVAGDGAGVGTDDGDAGRVGADVVGAGVGADVVGAGVGVGDGRLVGACVETDT